MMFQRFSLGFRTRECEGCSVAWVPLYSRNCLQALRISSLTAVGELLANVEVCVTIDASPDHHWPSVKRWSYHIVSFMCVKHVHSVKLLSSMKRAGYWCWMCQLCCLISAVWAARCGAQFPPKEIGFSCCAHGVWVWQFGQKTCRRSTSRASSVPLRTVRLCSETQQTARSCTICATWMSCRYCLTPVITRTLGKINQERWEEDNGL